MFTRMTGKQLAGWGYGFIWFSVLCELINSIMAAKVPPPNTGPVYWVGLFLAVACFTTGIRMMTLIRHRPW